MRFSGSANVPDKCCFALRFSFKFFQMDLEKAFNSGDLKHLVTHIVLAWTVYNAVYSHQTKFNCKLPGIDFKLEAMGCLVVFEHSVHVKRAQF
ncbi:hypothetical protein BASA81_003386 [Batrachochytrium salamandrivorans]|nr:hypothetical protein BASA81_003386 [Batrachochytrium salamandrivorans]